MAGDSDGAMGSLVLLVVVEARGACDGVQYVA
jgi:hypothetical protein